MFAALKNHPFAVSAYFEASYVLSYAFPATKLQALLPPCLKVDTFNGDTAFVAAAYVHTKHLRPKGFPTWLGHNFILSGYRIFVQYQNNAGKRLRGLYILKSETNNAAMQYMGNIFTHYNYQTVDINISKCNGITSIKSNQSQVDISLGNTGSQVELPSNSPFANHAESRRFAGPLPFTFTYNQATKKVLIIQGIRQHWQPQPIEVISHQVPFVQQLMPNYTPSLANAFVVENIPYQWAKGYQESYQL